MKAPTILEMLKHMTILRNFIITIILFMIISFMYYMIGFYNKYVGGNMYALSISQAMAEIIAGVVFVVIKRIVNFKWGFVIAFSMVLVMSVVLIFIDPENESLGVLITVVVFILKFGVSGGFLLIYSMQPEVFPSIFVATSFTVGGTMGRILTILSPMVAELP